MMHGGLKDPFNITVELSQVFGTNSWKNRFIVAGSASNGNTENRWSWSSSTSKFVYDPFRQLRKALQTSTPNYYMTER